MPFPSLATCSSPLHCASTGTQDVTWTHWLIQVGLSCVSKVGRDLKLFTELMGSELFPFCGPG